MKKSIGALILLSIGVAAGAVATPIPSLMTDIDAAIADAARPATQVEQDRRRKPAEVIAFAGIKRGDRIADFMYGNGYFSRLFSDVVGPTGRVYAFLPTQELANCKVEETAGTKALEQDKRYRNVHVLIDPSDQFAAPESLDLVWTALNYHDLHDKFMAPTNVALVNAAIFRALKPGGVLLIIDHVAAVGSGLRDTESLHRIDPQSIRSEVTAAGFVFEAENDALRNPEDAHTLPVFDPAIRFKTDQVVLKFRKPSGTNATGSMSTGSPRPGAAFIPAAYLTEAFKKLSPQFTDDEPIRVMDAGPYRLGLFAVGRPKKVSPEQTNDDGSVRVTEGLQLDQVGVVVRILKGVGTFVAGGHLVNPARMPANDPDFDVLGPGSRGKAILGGERHRVSAGDMVLISEGTPHGFSEIEQPLTYVVIRIDAGKTLPIK